MLRGLAGSAGGDVESDLATQDKRESMHFDLLVVGAGPAGLSAAIRFKQLCKEKGEDLSVCVIEKGAEVGAHILSGNVLQPTALDELIPGWREDADCPVHRQPATASRFYYLTERRAVRLPNPPQMKHKGNYVISLSEAVRWLGRRAEDLGVEIFPGFAGARVIYGPAGDVHGVQTNDFGIAKDGTHKPSFSLGMALTARATLFAEGCRGSLSQHVMRRFGLREKAGAQPQTYALGLKEVWEVDPAKHKPGLVVHAVGHPLPHDVYGGSFLYHMPDNKVALGLVVALDYSNPYLNMYQEFQQFKRHPMVARLLEGGTCLQYGARSLNEGGWQSIPALAVPGGALVGDAAGFLNVPKIKGTHTAMKSGMLAAEAAFDAMATAQAGRPLDLSAYETKLRSSWVETELYKERNIRPSFSLGAGLWGGVAYSAVDTYLLRGGAPWTLRHRYADHEKLKPAAGFSPKEYPKPDGKLTFDINTSLFRSQTNHEHDQPPHLRLANPKLPAVLNLPIYAGPEARYCPAGVYEYVAGEDGRQQLQINAQNCLHCKACDIKDPSQNIRWTVPEGGGGPSYTLM
ncbi:Electron transfer flavo -ubiquinone mitochondrial [Micractinium conductrix]|uniref:Electron transfer flavoprotein-ubiquinone oxidoreductase n=1 Tax=Micractinium conductrix TaxID=554055 RepID=A0A2P6VE22_9CHLO|nr:Electron transfer flavo -ubiquinone mitochondrial [Micractinium conductrix]|eukprot:PSC72345.1 Electron transfer flavo -ubiquinone mitochondrial [Micractinium conductrix]